MIAHCIGGPANGQRWEVPGSSLVLRVLMGNPTVTVETQDVIYQAVLDENGEPVPYDLNSFEFRIMNQPEDLPIWRGPTKEGT